MFKGLTGRGLPEILHLKEPACHSEYITRIGEIEQVLYVNLLALNRDIDR